MAGMLMADKVQVWIRRDTGICSGTAGDCDSTKARPHAKSNLTREGRKAGQASLSLGRSLGYAGSLEDSGMVPMTREVLAVQALALKRFQGLGRSLR